MPSEATVQSTVVKYARSKGWICLKQDAERGVPDFLMVPPNRRMVFIEFKRPGGKISKIQEAYHERLRDMCHDCWVIYGIDHGIAFIDDVEANPQIYGEPDHF